MVLTQSLLLGPTRIALRAAFDAVLAMLAGSIAVFMAQRPTWQHVQHWLMGAVLAGLAVRTATASWRQVAGLQRSQASCHTPAHVVVWRRGD